MLRNVWSFLTCSGSFLAPYLRYPPRYALQPAGRSSSVATVEVPSTVPPPLPFGVFTNTWPIRPSTVPPPPLPPPLPPLVDGAGVSGVDSGAGGTQFAPSVTMSPELPTSAFVQLP